MKIILEVHEIKKILREHVSSRIHEVDEDDCWFDIRIVDANNNTIEAEEIDRLEFVARPLE